MTQYDELSESARNLMAGFGELEIAQIAADAQRAASQTAAERDGAYRERAHLLAWLAALYPAVITPAPDTDEPGWHLLYLTPSGHQMSWHISPRDVALFAHATAAPSPSPFTWAESVASHGVDPTATIDIDINAPGHDEPVPVEIPLAKARELYAHLGGVLAEHGDAAPTLLARVLADQGVSQADLARRTRLSTKHINQICQGVARTSVDVAIRLEFVLGVPAAEWMRADADRQIAEQRDAAVLVLVRPELEQLRETRAAVDTDDLRERIAALFRTAPGKERLGDATPGEIADAVLPVVHPPGADTGPAGEVAGLRARAETAEAEVQRLGDWCRAVIARAETAEAARDRYADELACNETDRLAAARRAKQAEQRITHALAVAEVIEANGIGWAADSIRTALTETEPTP